jgi:integrase
MAKCTVSRSIWNGRIGEPKTRKGRAPVPVIRQLADRLALHRLRSGNPQSGPAFANALGKPQSLGSLVNRVIIYKRDDSIPEWHGWHAARRGLGSNLHRLGVPELTIQRILRHANVNTTATYYIKTADDDVRDAVARLENQLAESGQVRSAIATPEYSPTAGPVTIQ